MYLPAVAYINTFIHGGEWGIEFYTLYPLFYSGLYQSLTETKFAEWRKGSAHERACQSESRRKEGLKRPKKVVCHI